MARIIEFYVPAGFRRWKVPWRSHENGRGKLIMFTSRALEPHVWLPSGAQWPIAPAVAPRTARAARG
jgi:hypothetical protein